MNSDRMKEEFENLAARLGYTVRYERGDFRGDACRIQGERVIIMNRAIPVHHQNYAFARIFAAEDLGDVSVLPLLRVLIEEVGGGLPEEEGES